MTTTEPSSSPTNSKVQKVRRVALILSIVTGIEFVIAFTLKAGSLKTVLFVVLTLVKAFYIVGEFMHLSYERRTLIRTLLIPMAFILLLIAILLYESAESVHNF